ncbi:MAG: tRNA (N(6)-L-threonylcarbamoyladenosine(37)-C(2))-methylthiotransferase MtaB [Coriobacteriia bacterium]|nr:tRNA (N(6)-L-threonylcarbamoyladenosine(37)-C(2))-methylthiotransferase MtaB [Coriobacteriia bacterium]
MRIYIRTYGCKVNQVESEELAARFVAAGHELVRDEEQAQLYVINTCTVTGEADAKVRKGVRHAASLPRVEQVLVTGCGAAMHADELAALSEKVVVVRSGIGDGIQFWGPRSASGYPSRPLKPTLRSVSETRALSDDPAASSPYRDSDTAPSARAVAAVDASFHTRVAVKVQDGCENFCAYCIVPYARGASRSMRMADLLQQVAELAQGGTQEIVLTGINIGRYCDPETSADLPALIRNLHEQTGIHRIRLSSIEPPDVTDELCALLAEGILCEHLHIPLQSGSDRVLEAMGRRYTTADFTTALARVRAAALQTAVTTDVIVGFPTETDADFEATCEFCRAQAVSKIHVFRFSPRAGTPAASLSPLDPQQVAARAARLRELSAELAAAYAQSQLGRMLEWVVERIDPACGQATLTSREHLSMRISAADRLTGELLSLPFDMMKSMRDAKSKPAGLSAPDVSED